MLLRSSSASTGVRLAQDSALIDTGLDLNLSPTATLSVSYSGQLARNLTDNAVKGRFAWVLPSTEVRFWHFADIDADSEHVRS
jgi:hypothetical protein